MKKQMPRGWSPLDQFPHSNNVAQRTRTEGEHKWERIYTHVYIYKHIHTPALVVLGRVWASAADC